MTTIAICERVDKGQPVVEADRSFPGGVDVMCQPVSCIVHHAAQFDAYLRGIDTYVLAGAPEGARPSPNIAEQTAVKFDRETFRQNVLAARTA